MSGDVEQRSSDSAQQVRKHIRQGHHREHTAGCAPGCLQVNLVILPAAYAKIFRVFCEHNPRACPLISQTEPGQTDWPELGMDLDVRLDVPFYNIYERGELSVTVSDLTAYWRNDLVAFALGCSFTFEHALLRAGIPVRNVEANTTVPMFRTNIRTVSSGPFGGPMVVSMRPIPEDQVEQARDISARYSWAHGAPVHVGDPAANHKQ